MEESKKTIFSGIQPTGKLTLGNYLGALKNMSALQEDYNCIYCIVDMHSITVPYVPADLRAKSYELLALYLACGLNPDKSVIFVQSHVSAHAELTWILNCLTYMGEASRMTQFKDKSRAHPENVNLGLFDYPVLMASDILLYNASLVPVGQDQKQHVELARNLAERFNARYSPTFIVPQAYIPKIGGKIMSLADPAKKMSKSDDNENSAIYLADDEAVITRKLKRAVTDSGGEIKAAADKKGITNLLTIYSLFSGMTVKAAEKEFEGGSYAYFKEKVAQSVIDTLSPIQRKREEILRDKEALDRILSDGANKAEAIARKALAKVYKKVGFIERKR